MNGDRDKVAMSQEKPEEEWYLPDGEHLESIGPFSLSEILEKLKTGALKTDNYVWSPKLGDRKWRRLCDLPDFRKYLAEYPKIAPPKRSRGSLRRQTVHEYHFDKKGEYGTGNLYRRFPRVPLITDVIIHDNHRYIKGMSIDISENGLFVKVEDNPAFQAGSEIKVTIRNASIVGTFSVPATIVRVVVREGLQGFAMAFLRLNPKVRHNLCRYILSRLEQESKSTSSSSEQGVA